MDIVKQPLEYIENRPLFGLVYDWNLICKIYLSLDCPEEAYNPTRTIKEGTKENVKIYVGMSKRKTGKTTNWLIIGLIMYYLYGTMTVYMRQTEDMIAPKNTGDMYDTIIQYGYIEKITNGEFDYIKYSSRFWYLCKRENGEIKYQSEIACTFMCCVQKYQDTKSGIQLPFADLIIYDEFLSDIYYPDEFVHVQQLISSIKRFRRSAIVVWLANQIDLYSIYFNELCIADDVQKMPVGGRAIITTEMGTKIYVERIEQSESVKRIDEIDVLLYYGFKNPKLASITGDNWATKNYQHIPDGDFDILFPNIYIRYNNKYVRMDIVKHEKFGIACFCHWATKTWPDSIILTTDDRTDTRYMYMHGHRNVDNLLHRLASDNRIYYATNDVGLFIESYYNYIRKMRVTI